MFYRRKIILALLQLFEGELDRISLQKLLFLFSLKQTVKVYDFIPYKFGCYSYSAEADLKVMVEKNLLEETESHFKITEKAEYFQSLKAEDRVHMVEVKRLYGNMNANALMKYTYVNFPYWAINSTRAASILSAKELDKVQANRPVGNEIILFTIGYEGISLEEYLNRLIQNDIKVLIDVRNNPLSMKYGFSKSQLKRFCENLALQYVHLPEVGIQPEQRQGLNNQSDYDKLFEVYRKVNLSKTVSTQNIIVNLLKENKRVGLTCFEANICQCHRKHLAEAIENLPGFTYKVRHI